MPQSEPYTWRGVGVGVGPGPGPGVGPGPGPGVGPVDDGTQQPAQSATQIVTTARETCIHASSREPRSRSNGRGGRGIVSVRRTYETAVKPLLTALCVAAAVVPAGCMGADVRPASVASAPAVSVATVSGDRGAPRRAAPPPLVVGVVRDEPVARARVADVVVGAVEVGPALFDDDLVRDHIRVVPGVLGDGAVGGITPSTYALELVSGATGVRRKIARGEIHGEGSARVQLVDLEGDGRPELLVAESGAYTTCDLGGGGMTRQWLLVDAWGRVLYRSEVSGLDYDVGGPMHDGRVRARVVALGDGRSGVELLGPARRRVLAAVRR